MHLQNGTTFVPVVGWENISIKLAGVGRHIDGLIKRHLAPKTIVINGIAGRDKRDAESQSGVNGLSNSSSSRRDERGIGETGVAYNHEPVS